MAAGSLARCRGFEVGKRQRLRVVSTAGRRRMRDSGTPYRGYTRFLSPHASPRISLGLSLFVDYPVVVTGMDHTREPSAIAPITAEPGSLPHPLRAQRRHAQCPRSRSDAGLVRDHARARWRGAVANRRRWRSAHAQTIPAAPPVAGPRPGPAVGLAVSPAPAAGSA